MIPEEKLIELQYNSWNKIEESLSYNLGSPPSLNLYGAVLLPENFLPSDDPTSRKIDYEILRTRPRRLEFEVYSEGILVAKPDVSISPSGRVVAKGEIVIEDLEVSYFISGTNLPSAAREIYDEKTLNEKITRANIENCFRQKKPHFFYLIDYFRSVPLRPRKKINNDGRLIGKVLRRRIKTSERGAWAALDLYVEFVSDYLLSKTTSQYEQVQDEKDPLIETFESWTEDRGLKFLIEDPWEVLRDTMYKIDARKAEDRFFELEEGCEEISKGMKVYKLDINKQWKRLL